MMLSIDPGVGGTGFAVWQRGKLTEAGTIHFDGNLIHWEDKARDILLKFSSLLRFHDVDDLVIEYPSFMGGTGGHMVASSGDLVKLAVLTGMITGSAILQGVAVEPVPVGNWKGQLPKAVCVNRIKKILPAWALLGKLSDHAWDAIGIGLWKLGKFK